MRRNPEIYLGELEILVEQQVQHVLALARRWPDDPQPWDRLLRRYEVPEDASRARRPAMAGPPASEVLSTLARVAAVAAPAVAHFELQFADEIAASLPLSARLARLRRLLYDLDRGAVTLERRVPDRLASSRRRAPGSHISRRSSVL